MRCLGYSVDDPQVIRALDEFEKLGIEDGDEFRMQPCKSPVWEPLTRCLPRRSRHTWHDARMVKSADWILQKQVSRGRLEG